MRLMLGELMLPNDSPEWGVLAKDDGPGEFNRVLDLLLERLRTPRLGGTGAEWKLLGKLVGMEFGGG